MENQIENSNEVNVKGIILLVGTILGALTAWVATETFLGIITGLVGGLIFAIIFITALLPNKTHDR
ncbi:MULTISPECIES: hypothetical protein [Sphingobacterium]|uniref:Uncharacterized protein n=1 Tax=Sphingobacterium cellulitidis TaxID=1768011 RepID=A0A8H9FWP6_9SPHI|nr:MULTISPECIES: hypothetical protein [Sphingobacterium]MBA8985143.1 nicotinamide riboside transporter PnuC [Sphingobacterium soli]OYD40769.1 hypothetical protein CHT99_17370 [Sphingobacterium cellulitidis]OYD45474.1 hypothetical protein CHU00_10935 [Sphingobacterium cellulitidis]WFB63565.1 hypothetical protein PZ892_18095 [Sphingobacterium sp. WM]GGE11932.1 hypothetical protein GCM10011516_07120 [Sphingobacterium soli]